MRIGARTICTLPIGTPHLPRARRYARPSRWTIPEDACRPAGSSLSHYLGILVARRRFRRPDRHPERSAQCRIEHDLARPSWLSTMRWASAACESGRTHSIRGTTLPCAAASRQCGRSDGRIARHALDRDALVVEMREVDRDIRSGMRARGHQPTVHADGAERQRQYVGIGDVVIEHVDALAAGESSSPRREHSASRN